MIRERVRGGFFFKQPISSVFFNILIKVKRKKERCWIQKSRRVSFHTTDDVTVINGENQETKGIVQTKEVGTLQSGTLIG